MIHSLHATIVQKAPSLLKTPLHLVPKPLQQKIMLEALSMMFKEALKDGDFEFLQDKWLKVAVTDIQLALYISFNDDKLCLAETEQSTDVQFSANLNDLILIAGRKEDPDSLFFQRRLLIEGDTELGLEVKNLIDSVDLDSLPKPVTLLLAKLADFVYSGLAKSQPAHEASHAYSD